MALANVATATGLNAKTTGEKFGFSYCTTDAAELLADRDVDAVVIATRHDSHATFAADALRAGKAVFVEKPLALDADGLARVLEAQAETGGLLTVGYNRCFSPLAAEMKQAFEPGAPLAVAYRINAGPVPPESWIHDPESGGGRIVGEACHFVAFVQYLAGDEPVEVFAHGLGGPEGATGDTVAITVRFRGGSVASINYVATGDRAFPKERVEAFGGGTVAVLDDFRRLTISRGGRRRKVGRRTQQKGFDQEIAAFLKAVKAGGEAGAEGGEGLIPLASLAATTRVTFAVEEALRTGRAVGLA